MKIYKILPDYQEYCAFILPMKDVLIALGKEIPIAKLMHFYKYNLSLKDAWPEMHGSFDPVDDLGSNGKIPDVSVWVPGTLLVSNKVLKALPDMVCHGELLPVETPHGQYWILNCMNQVDADEKNSKNVIESGQVLDVQSIQFKDSDTHNVGLFKSPFDGYRNLFCSEDWMKIIQQNMFDGLLFSDELTNGFA